MKKTPLQIVNYYLAKVYYDIYLQISTFFKKPPVIVYQMGRVGSKTVEASLKEMLSGVPVHHVHWLTKEGLESYERRTRSIYKSHPGKHFWVGQHLRKQIGERQNRRKWNLVTLVRDPIARNISAFFHTLDLWYPNFNTQYSDQQQSILFKELVNIFLENFPHEIPLIWLDSEMRQVFGMDVFRSEFPIFKGYMIYHENMTTLLLIRLEDLNRRASEAFSNFLEIEGFSLVKANVSCQAEYGHIYRKFLETVNLPESYVDFMYSSKYARHFYTEEEIESFRNRWLRTDLDKRTKNSSI